MEQQLSEHVKLKQGVVRGWILRPLILLYVNSLWRALFHICQYADVTSVMLPGTNQLSGEFSNATEHACMMS